MMLGLLLAFGVAACVSQVCPLYGCRNAARLTGTVEVPASTARVDAKYCSAKECVEGVIDLHMSADSASCTEPGVVTGGHLLGDGVCLTRSSDGSTQILAQLQRPLDDLRLPDNGERYTLVLADHDSGKVLLDEARTADYQTTQRDSCHWCWSADMSL